VNINAQLFISHALVPRLLAREPHKRSAIINLSSVCAYNPSKMLSMYAATKAFNLHFGNCLVESYSDRIDVLNTTPNSTKTQMNSGRYVFSIPAETFACSTLNQLGWVNTTYGNWKHAIQPYVTHTPILGWIVNSVNNKRRQAWVEEEKAKQNAKKEQ